MPIQLTFLSQLTSIMVITITVIPLQGQSTFSPPSTPPSFTAFETTEAITLDGKLLESSWQQAETVRDFFKMEPRQGEKILYETFVKVLFDSKQLYFGVFCKDSVGRKGIRLQDFRRDFTYGENDVFYIQLDPQNVQRYCVSFQTSPLATQRDLQVFDDSFRDNDWDALWRVQTHVTDSGYYAEFAIPFKSLRYEKSESTTDSWGVTFARLSRRDYEQVVYPAIPQAFSPYRMNYAAQLKGLKLPPPSTNIRLQPYGLVQVSQSRESGQELMSKREAKIGGEIKWAIKPQQVLDITFNTDFAQADVDRAVNNLTRFNLFFPERRQFFLENSGIFAGADVRGLKPFFSRSIGLSNTQFNAELIGIRGGVRYTDRNQKRTLAGIYVNQEETPTQGSAHFGVFRYLQNYGKQNNVGVMVTQRNDEAHEVSGTDAHSNSTITIDGLIRPKNEFNIQYLITTSLDSKNKKGFAGNFWMQYTPNKFSGYWKSTFIDRYYKPGMGFTFGQNSWYNNFGGYYIWRPSKWKFIRRFDPGFFVNHYQNANNRQFQQADIYIFPVYAIFQNGSFFEYSLTPTWQNINFDFRILNTLIPYGNYFYTRQRVVFNTDQSKPYSIRGSYEFGNYFHGRLETTTISTRIAPSPHISLTAEFERNQLNNPTHESTQIIADLITGSMRLAVNPNIQATVFYQYNSLSDQGRWNMRASWQFAPLSFLYLVWNETMFQKTDAMNQSMICKLTYLKQF